MPSTRNMRTSILLVLAAAALLAACGSNGSSNADAATEASTTLPKTVPAGTTLRFGDQVDAIKSVLHTSKQDSNLPYSIKWASFVGGPPMLQAFKAGAIDAGFVASTPLIFAQAAKQDVVAVAAFETQHSLYDFIAAPGSHITSWQDLKGKKVAYQQGTAIETALLEGLQHNGLSLGDVKSVNLPYTQIIAALQGGSVDVAISQPPLDTAYLNQHPDAKLLESPQDEPLRGSFLIASKKALDDPAKATAIRDLATRLVRSYTYVSAHPDEWAEAFYVKSYHLPLAQARALIAKSGGYRFVPIPGTFVTAQQQVADLFVDAKEIPTKLDVTPEFDGRFNADVQKAQAG